MTKKETIVKLNAAMHENVGEHIGLEKGCKMVKDYADEHDECGGHFVGKNIIMQILNQPGCTGIKMYKALNEQGDQTYVFVGLDEKGKAILEYSTVDENGQLSEKEGIVANRFSPPRDGDMWWDFTF